MHSKDSGDVDKTPPSALEAPHEEFARLPTTQRSQLRRLYSRGSYERAKINALLDAVPLAHIAYLYKGAPLVTPTLQWREADHIYWHGSAASRMLELALEHEVCVCVSRMDGLVLARSAFHHSVNYASVMLFGRALKVAEQEKQARLAAFMEHLLPGRNNLLRPITAQELKATTLLSLEIREGSYKERSGPPKDDDADLDQGVWAGIWPVTQFWQSPQQDPLQEGAPFAPPILGKSLFMGDSD
jgi:uncharacterized protein